MWFSTKKKNDRPANRKKLGDRSILMVNARVTDQKRQRTNKVGTLVLVVAAATLSAWSLVYGAQVVTQMLFTRNDLFTIRKLDLQSSGKLTPGLIREHAKIAEGLNLFAVDIQQIRADLESVPLIKAADVRRLLPDTLKIRISERVPLARIGSDKNTHQMAVDRDGFSLLPVRHADYLPLITGVDERSFAPGTQIKQAQILQALAVLDLCDTTPLGANIKVASLDAHPEDHMVLRLRGGETVKLSRHEYRARLQDLDRLLSESYATGRLYDTIDLTVAKNIPVTERKALLLKPPPPTKRK